MHKGIFMIGFTSENTAKYKQSRIGVANIDNITHCSRQSMNQKITILDIHLAEDMRCRDEIQLLEGPTLLPCPWPGLAASEDRAGFKEFLFEGPAGE